MAKKANAKKRKKVIELRKPKQSKVDAKKLTIEERILRLEIDRGIVEPSE